MHKDSASEAGSPWKLISSPISAGCRRKRKLHFSGSCRRVLRTSRSTPEARRERFDCGTARAGSNLRSGTKAAEWPPNLAKMVAAFQRLLAWASVFLVCAKEWRNWEVPLKCNPLHREPQFTLQSL